MDREVYGGGAAIDRQKNLLTSCLSTRERVENVRPTARGSERFVKDFEVSLCHRGRL
jgi:hypothetical protein